MRGKIRKVYYDYDKKEHIDNRTDFSRRIDRWITSLDKDIFEFEIGLYTSRYGLSTKREKDEIGLEVVILRLKDKFEKIHSSIKHHIFETVFNQLDEKWVKEESPFFRLHSNGQFVNNMKFKMKEIWFVENKVDEDKEVN